MIASLTSTDMNLSKSEIAVIEIQCRDRLLAKTTFTSHFEQQQNELGTERSRILPYGRVAQRHKDISTLQIKTLIYVFRQYAADAL